MATVDSMAQEVADLKRTISQLRGILNAWQTGIETKEVTVNMLAVISGTEGKAAIEVKGDAHVGGEISIANNANLAALLSARLGGDEEFLAMAKGDRGDRGVKGDPSTEAGKPVEGREGPRGDQGPPGKQGPSGRQGKWQTIYVQGSETIEP